MSDMIKREGKPITLAEEKKDIFTTDQIELYETIFKVIDKNPRLDHKDQDHNTDFCLIKTKTGKAIEITRSFAMKCANIARVNYQAIHPPTIVPDGKYQNIAVAVRIWDAVSEVTEFGGCSTEEINEKNRLRRFHDALAIATTRGLKRGLEAKLGLPFVNMMILELFGNYDIQGRTTGRMRDVTPGSDNIDEVNKKLGREILLNLKARYADGSLLVQERNEYWNDVMKNIQSRKRLDEIKTELQDRDLWIDNLKEQGREGK